MEPRLRWEDFASSKLKPESARSVGQHLTHWATEAPAPSGMCAQFAFIHLSKLWQYVFMDKLQKLSQNINIHSNLEMQIF